MANTYNYLLNVVQKAKSEIKNHTFELLIALVLLTLPLHYRYNSLSLMLLCIYIIFTFKKNNFSLQILLLLPIFLYFLMALSLFWTIDFSASVKSLSKEIPLLLIPLLFLFRPIKNRCQQHKVMCYFGHGMVLYAVFYLTRALLRYIKYRESGTFFYHELVSVDTNAIYVSIYIAIAFFVFYLKTNKIKFDFFYLLILFVTLILLSSKNIIIVFFLLLVFHQLMYIKTSVNKNYFFLFLIISIVISGLFFNKIKDRFLIEFEANSASITRNKEAQKRGDLIYNVSIERAWNADHFQQFAQLAWQQAALAAGEQQQVVIDFGPGQARARVANQYGALFQAGKQVVFFDLFRAYHQLRIARLGHELAKPGQQHALVAHVLGQQAFQAAQGGSYQLEAVRGNCRRIGRQAGAVDPGGQLEPVFQAGLLVQ